MLGKFFQLKSLFKSRQKETAFCQWPPTWHERHRATFSPLMQRIMAVNAMALIILVGSVLYMGGYQDSLVSAELSGLSMQVRMSASAVAEGAVVIDQQEESILSPLLTRLMVRRLVEASETRTRVYDLDDVLIADSMLLAKAANKAGEMLLPPMSPGPLRRYLIKPLFDRLDQLFGRKQYPFFPKEAYADKAQYDSVRAAKEGRLITRVWKLPKGKFLLTVAAPIQRYKKVLGTVMLTRIDPSIKESVRGVRRDILKIFAAVLLFTTCLSMYLAWTIAQPIKTLSKAAEKVRLGQAQMRSKRTSQILSQDALPDLGYRNDEIGDLSLALREMTGALAKRIGAIENFAADVAHEIKNPLTSLRSAVETFERLKDPERQKKLMSVIRDDVDRLDRLITDISKASRLDAELTRDQADAVDVVAMLETLVNYYSQDIYHKQSEVKVVLDPAMPTGLFVSGVQSRLAQVLQNLIMNALSFAPPHTSVLVGARPVGAHYIEISVEDEGGGIPEAKLEAIFDRFYSERPKDEKFGTHSGLGLSISKQIVDAHNGRMWAENKKDEEGVSCGARFVVHLPSLSEA